MEQMHQLFSELSNNRWTVSQTTVDQRKEKLKKLKAEILKRREDIKAALNKDFKKPYPESELTEIHTCLDEINFAVKNLKKWMKPKCVPTPIVLFGARSQISYEAKGVVLILAPWNYPFSLLINPLVAAVAAGNCIIAKPSEKTPATAKILEEIISAVFVKNEVIIMNGDVSVAQNLLTLPFDHIFFTGSPQVGKKVMEAASKHLTSVTLELGGKSPVIIDKTADVKTAAKKIAWGKFINNGQTCVAPDYVYVHRDVHDDFLNYLKVQIEEHYGKTAEARAHSEDLARIIDEKAFDRLQLMLDKEEKLVKDTVSRDDLYIPPTVLKNVSLNSPIMKEEIFGPILPVLSYEKIETVIETIRSQSKPLALYIFSKDKDFIKYLSKATTSGGMVINQVVLHLANPHLPFGGVGTSGVGSYHGIYGFKAFSHEKSILIQSPFTLTHLYFPPYNSKLSKLAFRLLRFFE
jgi:aldehyde dehydrogenase (NAD+)